MTKKPNIRRWDFKARLAPRKSKDHPGDWAGLATSFAALLARAAPRPLAVRCEGVESERFGDLGNALTGPRAALVFRSQALKCPGLVVFGQPAADLLTNALHGGVAGRARSGDAALSGVGASLLKRVGGLLLEAMESKLFPAAPDLELKLTRQESSLEAALVLRDDETVWRARLRLEDGDSGLSGAVDIVLPAAAVAVFADARRPEARPDPTVTPAHLAAAVAEITAELGSVELTLRELLALDVGSEVPLAAAAGDTVTVLVEGRPKLTGALETRRGRRAVRII